MRIFLTGATGFVGRHLLTWLVSQQTDVTVTCLVRDFAKARAQWENAPTAQTARIRWLPGDLSEPDAYRAAIKTSELILHTAALVSLRNGPEFYPANTASTQTLLDTLQVSPMLERFVFISSISAIDRPLTQTAIGPLTETSPAHPNTDYGRSKLLAEQAVIASGLPYTILRPSYIYGPNPRPQSSMDRLVHDMYNGRRYTHFPFPGRISEIYAEDLAEMIWVAGQHPGTRNESYFVCNPEPLSVERAFRQLASTLKTPFLLQDYTPETVNRISRRLQKGVTDNLLRRILFEDFFLCDAAKWMAHTGFQPRYGFEEGLARTIHWYQQNERLPLRV